MASDRFAVGIDEGEGMRDKETPAGAFAGVVIYSSTCVSGNWSGGKDMLPKRYVCSAVFMLLLIGGIGGQDAAGQSDGSNQPVYSYSITTPSGGSGYQTNGNVQTFTDSVMGSWTFSYDNLNRLAGSQGNQPGNSFTNYCWSYDAFGNRTGQDPSTVAFQSGSGGQSPCTPANPPALTYNGNNQESGNTGGTIIPPSYDAAGNVTNDELPEPHQYLYDAEGRVCAVQGPGSGGTAGIMTGYIYDAEGRRVAKGTITTWSCDFSSNRFAASTTEEDYVLDLSGNQITEMASNGSGGTVPVHTNVWADGQLIGTYEIAKDSGGQLNSNLHFYFNDWLGSRRVQTDYSGTIEQTCSNLPYGDSESCLPTPTEHLYTGKERDAESGNDYFGARYYGSTMGRFMSPDYNGSDDYTSPVPYADLSNPQTLNLYAYAGNNPLTNVDPDGHNVHVCVDNGNGGQNCFDATDDQWKQIQQGNGSGITFNLNNFGSGTISCGGSVCGSAQYYEPGLQDESGSMLMGIAGGMAVGKVVDAVVGTVAGWLGRGATDAVATGAGKTAGSAAVDVTNLSAKIVKQMGTRGWTAQEITETVENGTAHAVTNKATGGAATEFVNPANGKFVVVDNATKQVIQVSGPGFSPNHLMNP